MLVDEGPFASEGPRSRGNPRHENRGAGCEPPGNSRERRKKLASGPGGDLLRGCTTFSCGRRCSIDQGWRRTLASTWVHDFADRPCPARWFSYFGVTSGLLRSKVGSSDPKALVSEPRDDVEADMKDRLIRARPVVLKDVVVGGARDLIPRAPPWAVPGRPLGGGSFGP